MEQMGLQAAAYSTAIYCRLSKDDGIDAESTSIGTQKMMLEKYCREQGYSIYDVYADDGYSGLNFNRPDFSRLLVDIDNGKINLIVTKDLSRLGRDYIQTGYYIEMHFSKKKIRYIAVNDGIDTLFPIDLSRAFRSAVQLRVASCDKYRLKFPRNPVDLQLLSCIHQQLCSLNPFYLAPNAIE